MLILILWVIILFIRMINPFIDITKDKIIIWYNWLDKRNYYILWKRQNF